MLGTNGCPKVLLTDYPLEEKVLFIGVLFIG
jgi:hypothetical protein